MKLAWQPVVPRVACSQVWSAGRGRAGAMDARCWRAPGGAALLRPSSPSFGAPAATCTRHDSAGPAPGLPRRVCGSAFRIEAWRRLDGIRGLALSRADLLFAVSRIHGRSVALTSWWFSVPFPHLLPRHLRRREDLLSRACVGSPA